ncbi:putative fimbrial outer membrane usher protein [Mycobacteroides abscessus subsp. abscessus]|nr:putative fimbrial outer membrane usher protein [Mycobacteroides abscessus subsp. abscessus]
MSVDTRKTDSDIEIEQTTLHVVPRRGAVPLIAFKGATGRRIQFEITASNGVLLPLAADVKGRAMVFLQQEKGVLRAKWSRNECVADYTLPTRDPAKAYQRVKVVCQLQGNRQQATR